MAAAAARARATFAGLVALGCNSVLGIADTSYRGEDAPAGQTAGTGAAAATPACRTNSECLAWSGEPEPSACVEGHCVRLLTQECPALLPNTKLGWLDALRHSDPDPVIFGVFGNVPPELIGLDGLNYDLALSEAARTVGGIPAAGDKRRPLLALLCKNVYHSPEAFDRAIDHLILELEVPGILAALESSDLEYAFRRHHAERQVFVMSPFEADPALLALDDDGLVWHILPGGESVAVPYGPLLDRTVAHLRNAGSLGQDEPARVALVTTDDVRMLATLSSALTSGVLTLDGRPVLENSADTFRAVTIQSSELASSPPDYTEVIELLREFAPHVLISAATDEFMDAIVPALERAAPAAGRFYLLSPWNVKPDPLGRLLAAFPDIYRRIAGVNFAAAEDRTIYDAYQTRFDAAFPAYAGTRDYENYYDAAYYLIYAAAGAGAVAPLTGADLASGMQRLLSGPYSFSVGPDDLVPGFTALEEPGSTLVLNGAMGPPDFDPRTGARVKPGSVWCVDGAGDVHMDVLRVDAAGRLSGDFPCFTFDEP
jgi:hypothetical protein